LVLNTETQIRPVELGYRMPAEWHPHQATWLSWPHNRDTWPGMFELVEPTMIEVVTTLAEHELVHINVLNRRHELHLARLLNGRVSTDRVRLHCCPTNDAWIRDHGAIFLVRADSVDPLLALDFEYNAWGGKYPPYDLDRQVARRMAEAVDVPCFTPGMVLEGGSIEVNGEGVLLTTEQCLSNPNRNPGLSQAEIETTLCDALGVERVVWLGDGIEGDDTDGHIDDLARFVADDTVVTVVEQNKSDPNHAALRANRRRLDSVELDGGAMLKVIELPMPEPLFNRGERLPASYANFYIANACVLVPVFDCRWDEQVCETLDQCFPDRRIVPIDCRALVTGLGALHCLTQQVPAAPV